MNFRGSSSNHYNRNEDRISIFILNRLVTGNLTLRVSVVNGFVQLLGYLRGLINIGILSRTKNVLLRIPNAMRSGYK